MQDALKNKYYQQKAEKEYEPSWLNLEIESEELDEEDKERARAYYKKYCDTEEEYHERLRDNGLEE